MPPGRAACSARPGEGVAPRPPPGGVRHRSIVIAGGGGILYDVLRCWVANMLRLTSFFFGTRTVGSK